MRSNAVYKLQTALGYVSLIDLPELPLFIFGGDPELFQIRAYDTMVTVKPITDEPTARTNFMVFTTSSRLTFEVTVGEPETADFILDYRLPEEDVLYENAYRKALDEKERELKTVYEEKEKNLDQKASHLAQEKFKEEMASDTKTIKLSEKTLQNGIELELLSLSVIGKKGYLRFRIRNLSTSPYSISRVVLGAETYGRKNFGLKKAPQGLIEISSELKIQNPVPPNGDVSGVVVFDPRDKHTNEYPVLLVFEDEGNRNLRLSEFKWVS